MGVGIGSVAQPEANAVGVIGEDAQATRLAPRLSTATALICGALILYARAYGLAVDPDPWLDEAMQMLNFLHGSWSGLLRPQPYFEQATSLGYWATGMLVADLVPEHLARTLRIFSAVASLSAAALLFGAVRAFRPTLDAALIASVAALAPTAIYQSIEIKVYTIEMLCTAALLATALNAFRCECSRKTIASFLVVAVASLTFANAAVFPIAGFGAALFLFTALERPYDHRRAIVIVAVGAIIIAVAALMYVGYTAPSTALQLEAYGGSRANGRLLLPRLENGWLETWARFLNLLQRPFLTGANARLYLLLHGLALLGLVSSLFHRSRTERFVAWGCALTLAAVALAAATGVFTPYWDRHVLFTTPLTAFFLATGLQTILAFAAQGAPAGIRIRLVTAAAATLVLAYGGYNIWKIDHTREPIRPALERLAAVPGWAEKTWVHQAAQPALDVQTWPRSEPYLGRVSHASSRLGWGWEVRRDPEGHLARLADEARARDELYILISHISREEAAPLLAVARRSLGPCRVISAARGTRTVTSVYHCRRPLAGSTPVPEDGGA